MQNNKRILLIGFEPETLDYISLKDVNAKTVMNYLRTEQEKGKELGWEIDLCLINSNGTDMEKIPQKLEEKFDCIVIGAGIRLLPEYFILFEKAINQVHQNAPSSKICFNTKPNDTIEAIKRWI